MASSCVELFPCLLLFSCSIAQGIGKLSENRSLVHQRIYLWFSLGIWASNPIGMKKNFVSLLTYCDVGKFILVTYPAIARQKNLSFLFAFFLLNRPNRNKLKTHFIAEFDYNNGHSCIKSKNSLIKRLYY